MFTGAVPITTGTGINRNIMECKVINGFKPLLVISVLIETLWNVKIRAQETLYQWEYVLIETLWNVKLYVTDN